MSPVALDSLDTVELAEICEFLAAWMAVNGAARAAYDHHVGITGSVADLQTDLRRLGRALLDARSVTT